MTDKQEWEDRYQNNKAHWDRCEISPNLLYWLETGLLKPRRILIPGFGITSSVGDLNGFIGNDGVSNEPVSMLFNHFKRK